MTKGFVVFPLILILTIIVTSRGVAYLVAKDISDQTIVAPISDFGHFEDEGELSLNNDVVSPVPTVSVLESNKNPADNNSDLPASSQLSEVSSLAGLTSSTVGQTENSLNVKLDSVVPANGNAGDLITLKGSGFGKSPAVVLFKTNIDDSCCATQADFWSENEIKIEVVADGIRGKVSIAVESADGKISNYLDFEVTSGLPVIEKVVPEDVAAGQFMAIYGEEFGDSLGHVNFYESGGVLAGECVFGAGFVWNNSQITCIIPEEFLSGEYNIEVITADGKESDIKEIAVN